MNRNKNNKNNKTNKAINYRGFTNDIDVLNTEENKADPNCSNIMSNAKK
ncbi:hypothetical protein [Clostridium sp. 'White wine YQ']|nr:hypothetical protein [Clostridium sp. 'White wine YQ']MDD7794119.1 hypothetical protein [Clostridium sp. 'White wine YQ']